jgi:hypothetical protein
MAVDTTSHLLFRVLFPLLFVVIVLGRRIDLSIPEWAPVSAEKAKEE